MKPGTMLAPVKHVPIFAWLLALATIITPLAQAQTFNVIHNFSGTDGANPLAGFTIDTAGNLYGTTNNGGAFSSGTVFKMNTKGKETMLYSFAGGTTDGCNPFGGLLRDKAGDLFGTTYGCGFSGVGTVFKVPRYGKEKVLYSFAAGTDGANPQAALTMDAAGNLYGTTSAGGSYGKGTVFRVGWKGGKWTEKVLYSFGQGTDGATPLAGVTLDAKHNIYGTTSVGGAYGYGMVFQLEPSKSGWTEHILHDFQDADDGGTPYAGLILDRSGNLLGAATSGGAGAGGTIFKLTHSKNGWNFDVLYGLSGWSVSGPFRDLVLDASGNLYGTTHCDGINSAGTVYELINSGGTWTYKSLYVFTGGSDGLYSFSNLVFDKYGNLYGTTNKGGANGSGVVFRIKP